ASPLTGVDVMASVDNGGTCTVTGGSGITVPANGSVPLSYSCTYDSAPAAGNVTATAAGTPSDPAGFDFGAASPTIVDGRVTVTDPYDAAAPRTFALSDPNPTQFTYSHTFSGDPAGTCTPHDNTAAFTAGSGAAGSSTATFTNCVEKKLSVEETANPS